MFIPDDEYTATTPDSIQVECSNCGRLLWVPAGLAEGGPVFCSTDCEESSLDDADLRFAF